MDQYSYRTYVLLIFLLLILFSTFSCKKKDEISRSSGKLLNSVTESSNSGTLVFGSSKQKKSNISKDNLNLTVVDAMDVRGQLFPVTSLDIIPEDMEIGPLLDFNIEDSSEKSFISSVINFFTDAEKGILNEGSLHPLYIENIKKLFSDKLNKQSYNLRIGKIVDDKGIYSANIRLVSRVGRVSGSVSADNLEGKWLISDISINMKQLEKEYLKKSEFNPLSYSNILLNY